MITNDSICPPGERLFVGRVLSMSARMSVVFVAPTLQQFLHPDDARDSDVFLYQDGALIAPIWDDWAQMAAEIARAVAGHPNLLQLCIDHQMPTFVGRPPSCSSACGTVITSEDEATLSDAPASSGQIADGFKSGAFYEARFFAERATDRLLTHSDVFFIWCVCVLSHFWCL